MAASLSAPRWTEMPQDRDSVPLLWKIYHARITDARVTRQKRPNLASPADATRLPGGKPATVHPARRPCRTPEACPNGDGRLPAGSDRVKHCTCMSRRLRFITRACRGSSALRRILAAGWSSSRAKHRCLKGGANRPDPKGGGRPKPGATAGSPGYAGPGHLSPHRERRQRRAAQGGRPCCGTRSGGADRQRRVPGRPGSPTGANSSVRSVVKAALNRHNGDNLRRAPGPSAGKAQQRDPRPAPPRGGCLPDRSVGASVPPAGRTG